MLGQLARLVEEYERVIRTELGGMLEVASA
jgi:hypothetical protein